jgi:hypothetical protein
MDEKTFELATLTAVCALGCGMSFAYDYVVAGAVFTGLFCTSGMITLALILRS